MSKLPQKAKDELRTLVDYLICGNIKYDTVYPDFPKELKCFTHKISLLFLCTSALKLVASFILSPGILSFPERLILTLLIVKYSSHLSLHSGMIR